MEDEVSRELKHRNDGKAVMRSRQNMLMRRNDYCKHWRNRRDGMVLAMDRYGQNYYGMID